jgi:inner membrane transporter RhtA
MYTTEISLYHARMTEASPVAAISRPRRFNAATSVPPHAFFLVSAVFHYLGPAFAVLLFAHLSVTGVTWLRIASAGLVFALWRKPWRMFAGSTAGQRRELIALGLVLGAMNTSFYLAIDRLPLGTVGAIEFLGPIALAGIGVRSPRNGAALALAVLGVGLLTDARIAGEPLGVALAFVNCLLFSLYIILGHRLARDGGAAGVDRLGAAMLVATLVVLPVGATDAARAVVRPELLLAGIGVGICSSVIPYVCDQLAMARLPRATFSLLLALLPAMATIIGVIVLRQIPGATEAAGAILVVFAVGIHRSQ